MGPQPRFHENFYVDWYQSTSHHSSHPDHWSPLLSPICSSHGFTYVVLLIIRAKGRHRFVQCGRILSKVTEFFRKSRTQYNYLVGHTGSSASYGRIAEQTCSTPRKMPRAPERNCALSELPEHAQHYRGTTTIWCSEGGDLSRVSCIAQSSSTVGHILPMGHGHVLLLPCLMPPPP